MSHSVFQTNDMNFSECIQQGSTRSHVLAGKKSPDEAAQAHQIDSMQLCVMIEGLEQAGHIAIKDRELCQSLSERSASAL